MATQTREKIDIKELKELMTVIKDPWVEVRGILKKKKLDSLKYQKKIRQEWER